MYCWNMWTTPLMHAFCNHSKYMVHYSGPSLIRTSLLPNNSVFIRQVSFGEREHLMYLWSITAAITIAATIRITVVPL